MRHSWNIQFREEYSYRHGDAYPNGYFIGSPGADDEGIFVDSEEPVGFAHRRLSIIDLGGGRQPMSNERGDVWIVFNGEIYNFPELKTRLGSLGHMFRTKSDTEVILHGYEQWGLDCLSHLNGMFALALWDSGKKQLMLARDHAGIKPLYYTLNKETLLFGSEIRALLATGKIKPSVNLISRLVFLRYQYTPSPHTIFEGVKKLAAGSRLVVENGRATVERWWNFCPQPLDPSSSGKNVKEEVLCLYEGAVKQHLLSDVPIGLLLSGGLDSTLLLALMNRLGNDWPTSQSDMGDHFADGQLRDAAVSADQLAPIMARLKSTETALRRRSPRS